MTPPPPADGVTEYTETITGGALAYDGADGNAHVTPVSATEYKVGISGAGAGA
ncbi:hypothetical protein ACIRP0_36370 [Streptomyces sp. NPDC101733]|uniref:hypothetical protein n=1 Tax=unclassified Streptomyces TaxID=2593676 RepID=UPI00380E9EFF